MTKKDLIKVLRGLPDNAQIVIKDDYRGFYLNATKINVEKKARIKKVILGSECENDIIWKDILLDKSKNIYNEHLEG